MAIVSLRAGLFLFLGFIAIILPTAPISIVPTIIESPDILICLIFSWLIYDPKSASVWSILILCLFADILWLRPIGLWPMAVLIATELTRNFRLRIKNQSHLIKFILFVMFFCVVNMGVKVVSLLGALKSLDFVVWLKYFLVTILSFPIVNILLGNTIFRRDKNFK